jgi:hypothetical protein
VLVISASSLALIREVDHAYRWLFVTIFLGAVIALQCVGVKAAEIGQALFFPPAGGQHGKPTATLPSALIWRTIAFVVHGALRNAWQMCHPSVHASISRLISRNVVYLYDGVCI